MEKLFVLKQMLKLEMTFITYQMRPHDLQAKTYVNMKMVKINLKEKLKMERRMMFGLNGKRMVR